MMADRRQLPKPKGRADYLAQALAVEGGHLFIGGGGWFLHYAPGATLRGYDLSVMKTRCVEAGLPVIDILRGAHKLPIPLPFVMPMVAVGRPPDQAPWCSSSYAPLAHVAAVCRDAGAEVINTVGGQPHQGKSERSHNEHLLHAWTLALRPDGR